MGVSDESGIPSAAFNIQLDHDRRMQVAERLDSVKLQGARGLGALNGAAAVACLALAQALAARQALAPFKPYAVASLALFLGGAFLAGIAFFSHYAATAGQLRSNGSSSTWGCVYWALLVVAAVSAFVGGVVIVRGIADAL